MYLFSLFTHVLHFLPGELAHHVALKSLKVLHFFGITKILVKKRKIKDEFCERDLRKLNPKLGIAAGLDKNGEYIDCLAALGISFIEVGTVTPRPQKGNPKPRVFRNLKEKALLNRLGFNNKGVDSLVRNLKRRKTNIIVGSSIGKNFDTPNEKAYEDYVYCLNKVYEHSDYIAVNISSPNTQKLRDLSKVEHLDDLLKIIKSKQQELSSVFGYKPIFIKISPDESSESLKDICNSILTNNFDGIICSNTTINHSYPSGSGGLSGGPLKKRATDMLIQVRELIGDKLPIIASGGVMTSDDYQEKIEAGANHVQLYTGFIFEGPRLIDDIVNLDSRARNT
tara:strand:+ start:7553 stop:8569 length:1017 start_codon:yes stop_codon:yes gene_type:complete